VNESAAGHWDDVYERIGERSVSWFQEIPARSLAILDELGVHASRSIADVGAGASRFVDELVRRGFGDITVLDVSVAGLEQARARLGDSGAEVTWTVHDVLTWDPHRTFDVWHDRAVFHFLTSREDTQRYLAKLARATAPGSLVLVGTFAEDGPTHCSGLPVSRYSPTTLAAVFADYELLQSWREEHRTPAAAVQAFTWVALRRPE
jgi:trans-aconitate methyltransferase